MSTKRVMSKALYLGIAKRIRIGNTLTIETARNMLPKIFTRKRVSPLDMSPEEFRKTGHALVDRMADLLKELPKKPVTTGESPSAIRTVLGEQSLPEKGAPADQLLEEAATLLTEHSLYNGHPRFMGYVTASGAPIGALGELLATMVNPNVGAYILSPMATEIERQTVKWIAEMIAYPVDCGGLFVSGGAMANYVGYLAARRSRSNQDVRKKGLKNKRQLTVYCSEETHTWVQKAADLFGQGTDAIRWIETDERQRMDPTALERRIRVDLMEGNQPFLVVGTAGTVSTGKVDPLADLARLCRQYKLWLHVDGAYGAPAAMLPENAGLFDGLSLADSIALDPHKWLYSSLEAGCILVRNSQHLRDAFAYQPAYYNFEGDADDPGMNFFEYGLQNSRGFRALKVWLAIRQSGRSGYIQMIRDDIELAAALYKRIKASSELEAFTRELSVTTFRYVPPGEDWNSVEGRHYLNRLNAELVNRLQESGEAFVSNAIIQGNYLLRSCIVNFRTSMSDIKALPEVVIRHGRAVHMEMQQAKES